MLGMLAQISTLKLAWTTASLTGVVVTFALFFMSVTDYRLLAKRGLNGWRKHVSKTSVLIFFGGFMTQAIYFVTGVLALTQSNKNGSSLEVRHATQILFLCGAIVAIALAIVIFYRRLHILDVIEKAISTGENNDSSSSNH